MRSDRRAAVAAGLLLAACAGDELGGGVIEDDPAGPGGRTSSTIAADNGLSINGLGGNGLGVNGLAVNGIGANGIGVNGLAVNGVALNGLHVNGIGVNGIGVNGIAVNGLGANGLYVNGIGVNGLYVNGVGGNGLHVNGIAVNGIAVNGVNLNGIAINGLYVNGIAVNGGAGNGIAVNGLYVDGAPLTGVGLHGLVVNGAGATGIVVGGPNGTLGALPAAQATELVTRVLPYLAYCALPAPAALPAASCASDPGCLQITDASGVARQYYGSRGLAPGWKTGALGPSASDLMEGCLTAACDASGSSCQKGIALNAEQEARLHTLLKYMVECALPAPATAPLSEAACAADAGCANIRNSAGAAVQYHGALGLAGGWRDGPLDPVGQQRVTACLGSRVNAAGEHVMISLRGMGLGATPVEKNRFNRQEGGFYGNLFASAPHINVCEVDGGGMAGRTCADGECGFTNAGPCATACATHNADGTFSGCGGSAQVLNTFLPFQRTMSSGDWTSFMVHLDGTVWGWGQGTVGELGDGTWGDRYTVDAPVHLPDDGFKVTFVKMGDDMIYARKANGTFWAWGGNDAGSLGDGTTVNRSIPVQIALSPVIDVAMNDWGTTCAIKADGSLWCWGRNQGGNVGNGTRSMVTRPWEVKQIGLGVVQVGVLDEATCVLKSDGGVWCWGQGSGGELGNGSTSASLTVPQRVTALGTRAIALESTSDFTCVLRDDATVWCWGNNWSGGLGQGHTNNSSVPVQVKISTSQHLTSVKRLVAGDYHICAIRTDHTLWCWGSNDKSQMGYPRKDGNARYATQLAAYGDRVADVVVGWDYQFVLLQDGTIKANGRNDTGNLGDKTVGPNSGKATPVRMIMSLRPGDGVCEIGESSITEASDCRRPEVCQGGMDDDGDGSADCADADCASSALCGGAGGAGDTTAPTAPAGLLASAAGHQIDLTWTPSTDAVGVAGYRIERCAGAGCTGFVQVGTASAPAFASGGLTGGTSYSFRVRAIDAAGNLSGYSNTASATTATSAADTAAPTTPGGLVASEVSTSQIDLRWDASSDAVGVTGYRIERCTGEACTAFVQVGVTTGVTYSSVGLSRNTRYRFRVRAGDAAGNLSSYSSVAAATTKKK